MNAITSHKPNPGSWRATPRTILTVFGTRPEAVKLAPVIRHFDRLPETVRSVTVASTQHLTLVAPFIRDFGIRVDHDLRVMRAGQTPTDVCSRVLAELDEVLVRERPDCVMVQGDTTTSLAGALAAFHRSIPVAHVEAGLRSGNAHSPFPEEMNRRLITRLTTFHFAATERNRKALVAEGIDPASIFVTGNPVVDAVVAVQAGGGPSPRLRRLLDATRGRRRILLTTHRRESFGPVLVDNLAVVRGFVDRHPDVVVVFPVHPNPMVVEAARSQLDGHPRIRLVEPLDYPEFIGLMAESWLILSDSGGVQEEAPSLGKPVLILRENTERPEVIEAGVARLVGGCPRRLAELLEEAARPGSWVERVTATDNPFGRGDSGPRIAETLSALVAARAARPQ